MQRFKYSLNGQFHQVINVGTLLPSFAYETVPGDSFNGKVRCKFLSNPTTGALLNRVFLDHFMFYVPWRLVWDLWPAFISRRVPGQYEDQSVPDTPPYYRENNNTDFTDNMAHRIRFWAKQPLLNPGGSSDLGINALPLWAYQLIHNTYFRRNDEGVRDYADGISELWELQQVNYTNADFHNRLLNQYAGSDTTIDVSGSTITVDDVRQAFSMDQFNKHRQYYGDKYTDYLRSLGVQSSWSVLEEPEFLGKQSNELQFNLVSNTAATEANPLGEKSGYYTCQFEHSVPKRFFAEHGIVIGLYCLRPESSIVGASHPMFAKDSPEAYWSPEYDSEKEYLYNSALIQRNALDDFPDTQGELVAPRFLDYKSGLSLNVNPVTVSSASMINYYLSRPATNFNQNVSVLRGGVQSVTEAQFADMFIDDEAGIGSNAAGAALMVTNINRTSSISKGDKPIY